MGSKEKEKSVWYYLNHQYLRVFVWYMEEEEQRSVSGTHPRELEMLEDLRIKYRRIFHLKIDCFFFFFASGVLLGRTIVDNITIIHNH